MTQRYLRSFSPGGSSGVFGRAPQHLGQRSEHQHHRSLGSRRSVPRWRSGLGFRASVTYASTWSCSVCHPLAPDGWGGNDSADRRRPLPSVVRTVTTWPPAAGCHT